VVEARYRELFSLILGELRRSGFEHMVAAGLVMTGGASRIEGAGELAEEIFHMPVRLAVPQGVTGLSDVVSNAIHATGVGLLLYGSQAASGRSLLPKGGDTFFDRIRSWFRGEF
jgi:cell division protein FtsA